VETRVAVKGWLITGTRTRETRHPEIPVVVGAELPDAHHYPVGSVCEWSPDGGDLYLSLACVKVDTTPEAEPQAPVR
jgi:hypothetical protein